MLNETVLVIWMLGLMTHVGDDKRGDTDIKQAVAVVMDRHGMQHQPIMGIIDRLDVFPPRLRVHQFKPGDSVTFQDITSGGASADEEFGRFIPSLTEPLTNSLVDEPIKAAQRHDDVAAWIHYPKGELEILGLKRREANFFHRSKFVSSQCVPVSTLFRATAKDTVRMYIENPNYATAPFDLENGALLIILNQPPPHATEPSRHFANYGALLERRYGVIMRRLVSVKEGQLCAESKMPPGATLGDLLPEVISNLQVGHVRSSLSISAESPATTIIPNIGALLRILAGEHPACTNTDWP